MAEEDHDEAPEEEDIQEDQSQETQQSSGSSIQEKAQKARAAGQSASTAGQSTVAGVKGAAAVLANPVTWVIVALILVLILTLGLVQIVGRTDNADGCFGIGSGTGTGSSEGDKTVSVKTSKSYKKNAKNIGSYLTSTNFKFLDDKPMSKEQAAAFIGNWKRESKADPTAGQSAEMKGKSNDDVIDMEGSGNAVGLVQWDGGRRTELAKVAKKNDEKWNKLGGQLAFVKQELDKDEYGSKLAASGFNKKGASVKKLTTLVNKHYEISADEPGDSAHKERVDAAKQFAENFKGGGSYSSKQGESCKREDNSDDADGKSKIVKLAIKYSYSPDNYEKSNVSGDNKGVEEAKPAYKKAKKDVMDQKGSPDEGMPDLYASCDRFIKTVYAKTVDKKIPWGDTGAQKKYFDQSDKWKKFTKKSDSKAGDVWITKQSAHVMIDLGKYKGKHMQASASYFDRVAAVGPASYLNKKMVDTGGRAYVGYHYKG